MKETAKKKNKKTDEKMDKKTDKKATETKATLEVISRYYAHSRGSNRTRVCLFKQMEANTERRNAVKNRKASV